MQLTGNKNVVSELRIIMMKHIDRKSNEIFFCKCVDPACSYCSSHPIRASKMWEFLREKEFKWLNPVPSTTHPGHYPTFLEILQLDKKDLALRVNDW